MFPEEESEKKKTKAVALGKPAAGQCLCGKVVFEIDVPARWAWHDHSPSSRRAHGAAYATYVGSWRKRFRITRGKTSITRYEDAKTKTARSFCASCGTPIFSEPQGGAIWVVKAGTLDDPSWLKLGGNVYTKSAQPWAHIDPNLVQFEKMPPGAS